MTAQRYFVLPTLCMLSIEPTIMGRVAIRILDRITGTSSPLLEMTPREADLLAGDLVSVATEIINRQMKEELHTA